MRNQYYFFFILSLCILRAGAQGLTGRVIDADSAHTPIFQAKVIQMQKGKVIATCETYFDGTYSINVRPGQTYQLRVYYPGRADTTVSITIDKSGKLSTGSLVISLPKVGLRLKGFIMDPAQDIPIPDVHIILRNIMTRAEQRYTTGVDGAYYLMMDYETNYTLKIDKMSPGILNKYEDTSFNISTIGFNKPLEFNLDINLGPATGYTRPRPGYDDGAGPANKNIKPALRVLGIRDSLRRHQQDSLIALIIRRPQDKDLVKPTVKKNTRDISTPKPAPRNKEVETEQMRKDKQAAQMAEEVKRRKQELEEEHQRAELAKADSALRGTQAAEKAALARQNPKTTASELQKREELQLDNILKMAEAPKKEPPTHRKHAVDSMMDIASQRARDKPDAHKAERTAAHKDSILAQKAALTEKIKAIQSDRNAAEQDSLLAAAEARDKQIMASRRHIRDSLLMADNLLAQSKKDKQKDQEAADLAEKLAREKEAEEKNRAEIALKEKQKRDLAEKRAKKEDQGRADGPKTGHYVADQKSAPQAEAIAPKPDSKPLPDLPAGEVAKQKVKGPIHIVSQAVGSWERDDFVPTADMSIIQFDKNSDKMPMEVPGDLETVSAMMKDMPELKIKIYGLASVDEKHSMKLSADRARQVADLLIADGIKSARIRTKGVGATGDRSGCTGGDPCPEARCILDRVVMYELIKE